MKIRFILFLLSGAMACVQIGCAQGWQDVKLNSRLIYEVTDEDKVVSREFFREPNDTIRASILVDNDDMIQIRFTRATLRGDSLQLVLYENSEAFSNRLTIHVYRGKYLIKYRYRIDIGEDEIGEIIPLESNVSFNTMDFAKGREIRGSIKLKGRRSNSQVEDIVVVNGNFKVVPH